MEFKNFATETIRIRSFLNLASIIFLMKEGSKPAVSIAIATYREPKYVLKEAIESILQQSFKNFEFIIVLDDPNNKESENIIKSYRKTDKRIVFIKNKRNQGFPASMNEAIKISRGKYFAIMGADDVSHKNRLDIQYKYMESHPETDFLSGQCRVINENGKVISGINPSNNVCNHSFNKKNMFRDAIFIDPLAFAKRSVLSKLMYDSVFLRSSDWDLWLRAINDYNFKVLPRLMLDYRVPGSFTIQERISRSKKDSYWSFRAVNKNFRLHFLNGWFIALYFRVFLRFVFFTLPTKVLYLIFKFHDFIFRKNKVVSE